ALREQPEAMLAAVREVLHINPAATGAMRLWVHPADLELVRQHLADELREGHWRVLADESIARGGCRAETPYGDIDATLQTRWRRIAASLGRSVSWESEACAPRPRRWSNAGKRSCASARSALRPPSRGWPAAASYAPPAWCCMPPACGCRWAQP